MEKKLEFTDSAKSQIDKITKSDEKNISELLFKAVDALGLNIILALMIK